MTSNWMAFFPANFALQSPHENDQQPHSTVNPLLTSCTPQDFPNGVPSFLGKRSMPFSGIHGPMGDQEGLNGEDDFSDDGSQIGEKKRRLNMDQVKTLEKNFELGNKLEPERKMQLARDLGLQPRQIAIWFQNRRARWKTKQLEKDYDLLKRQFDSIKAENEALHARNQKLQAEMLALKTRTEATTTESINLNIKETDQGSFSNRSTDRDNSSDDNNTNNTTTTHNNNINLNNIKLDMDISRNPAAIDSPLSATCHSITSRPLFPSSLRPPGGGGVPQLFQNPTSTRAPHDHIHHPRNNQMVKEESLSNMMFCAGIDDQSGFWPWLEQPQHFN